MVKSFFNPCLVYEPGAAPTKPPVPFAAPGVVAVPDPRPPKEDPADGLENPYGRKYEIPTWSGALPDMYIPPADLQTTVFDANAGEDRLRPYNPDKRTYESAVAENNDKKAKKASTYDPDYSFKKYTPSPLKSTLKRNTRNNVLKDFIYEDFELIRKCREGFGCNDLFPVFNLRRQYGKLRDNLADNYKTVLDKLNTRDQERLLDLVFETSVTGKIDTEDFEYRRRVLNKRASREKITSTGVNKVEEAYNIFKNNSYPLNPERYDSLVQQKQIQTFKFIPSDIDKRITVLSNSIGETRIAVNNDDSYDLKGTTKYIYENDTIDVRTAGGTIKRLPITTDIDLARYTDLDVLEDIYETLGYEYTINISTETDTADDREKNFNLSAESDDYYLLTLDNSSIETSSFEPLGLQRTTCNYDLQTVEATFNDIVKFRAFPYLMINVSNEDPFLIHLIRSQTATVNFLDLDFSGFDLIHPRRIPYHIMIVVTDSEQLNFYSTESRVTELTSSRTVRELNLTLHPDSKFRKSNLEHPYLQSQYSYPGENIDGYYDTQGIRYSTYLGDGIQDIKYVSGSEQLPRTGKGVRQFLRVTESLVNNYEIDGGLVWFDVLSRLSFSEVYDLLMNNSRLIFSRFSNQGVEGVRFTTSKRNFQTGLRGLTGTDEYDVITQPYTL